MTPVSAGLLAHVLVAATGAAAADLAPILDRAGRYVVGYADEFKNVFATEDYRQVARTGEYGRPIQRATRADVIVVTLPGDVPWVTFRDVYEADGHDVRSRGSRLEELFRDASASAVARARALLEESSRYNLGPLHRTVNVPTLALLFLQPDNQARFAFQLKGAQTIGGVKAVEVAFEERSRPTVVRDDSGIDVPSTGRLWIDPTGGAVLRTEVEYRYAPVGAGVGLSSARIATDYRQDPRLGILVPVEMQERYEMEEPPAARRPPTRDGTVAPEEARDSGTIHIQATAHYSAYHRFETQTQELFSAAPETSR